MPAAAAAPAEPRSGVTAAVFTGMVRRILAGEWAAGAKLPTQRSLAAEYGVTMTAMREALRRLEQLGVIDVRQGDATRVQDWRESGSLDVLGFLVVDPGGAPNLEVVGSLFEARTVLLRTLAELAAQRRTDAQGAELVELADAVARAPEGPAAVAADWAFYDGLARISANVVFRLVLNTIRDVYFEHAERFPVTVGLAELAPRYHAAAAAVAAGDADAAGAAVEALAIAQLQRVVAAVVP